MKRETRLVRLGRPDLHDGPVNPPVERASTVLAPGGAEVYDRFGKAPHYGRGGLSPNTPLRETLAALYGADHVALTGCGLSAVTLAILAAVHQTGEPGGEALISDSVYGPVRRFCDEALPAFGIQPKYYDPRLGAGLTGAMGARTRLVLLESPGSLTFEVQDIGAIAQAARAAGAVSVIDDTWSAGWLMNPLDLGVDYAAQALTKYAGGHSDVLMGSVAARGDRAERLRRTESLYGGHVSPDDAYLVLRGMRTLGLRMERSGESGRVLAERLEQHPRVARVLHPGLASHPDHALFSRDFSGSAGCFSMIVQGLDQAGGEAFVDRLALFGVGFSWGGYESLALPCDRQIRRTAIPWKADGALIRLAIGLEDVDDLWADLRAALDALRAA